jgi:myosin-3
VANEQLQYYFNQNVFAWELQELRAEGVKVDNIRYSDNKPLLDLFLQKPLGLFAILDEESYLMTATDESLTAKLKTNLGKSPYFTARHSPQDLQFCVKHYASEVHYTVPGFLEKNRDKLSDGILGLLLECGVPLIRMFFRHEMGATGILGSDWQDDLDHSKTATVLKTLTPERFRTQLGRNTSSASRGSIDDVDGEASFRSTVNRKSRRRRRSRVGAVVATKPKGKKVPTVGAYFKESLKDLMTKIMQATPHFIRCIKPNTKQLPDRFQHEMVQRQLTYTGVMETVAIRRDGFPVRLPFEEFAHRYHVLGLRPGAVVGEADAAATCVRILSVSGIEQKARQAAGNALSQTCWELGHTKIFLKYFVSDLLAEEMTRHHKLAVCLQAAARGFATRRDLARQLAIKRQAQERARQEAMRRAQDEADRQRREDVEAKRRQNDAKKRHSELAKRKAADAERRQAEVQGRRQREEAERQARIAVDRKRREAARKKGGSTPSTTSAPATQGQVMVVEPFSSEEYEAIDMALIKKNRIPPGCSHLNRYNNILPNPRTRVRLKKQDGDDTTTYINANYVHGYDGGHGAYIATQGPIPETISDFWRMVWEVDSQVIVMVTGLKEKGRVKCERYWPKVGGERGGKALSV